jgi:hypothetical protein
VRVEHFARAQDGAWTVRSYTQRAQVLALPSIEAELPLEEVYDRIDAPQGLAPLPEPRPEFSGERSS